MAFACAAAISTSVLAQPGRLDPTKPAQDDQKIKPSKGKQIGKQRV